MLGIIYLINIYGNWLFYLLGYKIAKKLFLK